MKIKITGKELKITEAINDYVEKKLYNLRLSFLQLSDYFKYYLTKRFVS